MPRIFIAFDNKDVLPIGQYIGAEDFVVGDIETDTLKDKMYFPLLGFDEQKAISASVIGLFDGIEKYSIPLIKGFANNFFECSVLPLARYLYALKALIHQIKDMDDSIEVVFPRRLLLNYKTSAYYMAEHESQGIRLYSREGCFLAYLLEICKNESVSVKYIANGGLVSTLWYNPIRLVSVYVYRLMLSLFQSGRERSRHRIRLSGADVITVTRTSAQSEFIEPFLRQSGLLAVAIAAESFFSRGRNWSALKSIANKSDNIEVIQIGDNGVLGILGEYIQAARYILTMKKHYLNIAGIDVNMNQALSEVFVMLPSLILYQHGLESVLGKIGTCNRRILFSTEQKSPHALVDAVSAKKHGLRCVHLMQCDQMATPLPFPIWGDYFFVDSPITSDSFRASWQGFEERVHYIGSLKACNFNDDNDLHGSERYNGVRWCFFAHSDDVQANIAIIMKLRELKIHAGLSVMVKLHPRDFKKRYVAFSDMEIIEEGELRKSALFGRFTHALSFPSGIVLDLIYQNKPFILLRFGPGRIGDSYHYADSSYAGIISDEKLLDAVMLNFSQTENSFLVFRRKFMDEQAAGCSVHEIKERMFNILSVEN